MDRTNWKWGKSDINILTISIEHFGIGIPVFWTVLDTGENSSLKDGSPVVEVIGLENIEVLLADREFIGEPWCRFLIEEKIPFIIRVKQNFLVKGAKEPMIVISNNYFPNALYLYRWRWGIETLFFCLKSRGFCLEDTHMTDPRKIEKLMFILAIGVCWAYKTGELQA